MDMDMSDMQKRETKEDVHRGGLFWNRAQAPRTQNYQVSPTSAYICKKTVVG
jgi:hypothetical protein